MISHVFRGRVKVEEHEEESSHDNTEARQHARGHEASILLLLGLLLRRGEAEQQPHRADSDERSASLGVRLGSGAAEVTPDSEQWMEGGRHLNFRLPAVKAERRLQETAVARRRRQANKLNDLERSYRQTDRQF